MRNPLVSPVPSVEGLLCYLLIRIRMVTGAGVLLTPTQRSLGYGRAVTMRIRARLSELSR
ncbi:MAG: hypothetical protein M0Q49_02330 [Porticoccaceae bacterium]|nr:hypothetical protein [Porticoccaceae bacterium]